MIAAASPNEVYNLPLSPQAHEELTQLHWEVLDTELSDNDYDTWTYIWGAATFKAKDYYEFCFRNIHAHVAFEWLWKSKSVPKHKVFGWLLMTDRLNTRNMLKRRHYNIGSNLDCLLCGTHTEETVEHLFFHCTFSTECWRHIDIRWTAHTHRLKLLEEAKERWDRPLFMDIFLVAAWSLWKERNNNYFRHIVPTVTSWEQRFKADFSNLRYRTSGANKDFISAFITELS